MQPIHELLARIHWDAEFGKGDFVIGFWDRLGKTLRRIRLSDIRRDSVNPHLIAWADEDGMIHDIPLHRIRAVWRNGVLIWQRRGATPSSR